MQIRTAFQQEWAELSEKCSDLFGLEIKYGGGPQDIHTWLSVLSETIASQERSEVLLDSNKLILTENEFMILQVPVELKKEDLITRFHGIIDRIRIGR